MNWQRDERRRVKSRRESRGGEREEDAGSCENCSNRVTSGIYICYSVMKHLRLESTLTIYS